MDTTTQTNVQKTLVLGDNELMSIDIYLDARFGQGSIQAITIMHDIAELKKMLTDEIVHFVFEKTDGTRRDAYGTRAIDVIGSTTPALRIRSRRGLSTANFHTSISRRGSGDASRLTGSS